VVRVGFAKHYDTATAVNRCIAQLGAISPTLLLVFCGGKLIPEVVVEGFRAAFDDVPVVGGSAAGVVSRDGFGYSGLELGVLAFLDPAITPICRTSEDLTNNEVGAGAGLGAQVASLAADDAVTLLLFDSVASSAPPRLHYASSIVEGFNAGLAGKPITLIGGGLLTDLNLSDGWVFDGAAVRKHVAVALVFPAAARVDTSVLHGCRPVSTFMDITRIEGAEVFELDGKPALGVIEAMLGLPINRTGAHDLSLIATLGEKQGDPFAPYDENAYVNRLILTADREHGSVTLFEPDFHPGTRVQIMSRDNLLMLDSVRTGAAEMNRITARGDSIFSLYIDCAGRASGRSGAMVEEAEVVVRDLDPSVPLLGFYSGVEIAPFNGYSRPLDWTGVLAAFRMHR
jgi:hypothetical protein